MNMFCIWLGALLIFSSCKKEDPGPTGPPNPPPSDTLSFSQHILPLFQVKGCATCHGGSGGLTVTSVASLMTGGLHGPAIIPGNADSSILIQKIGPAPPFGSRMPQGGPFLSTAEIDSLRLWINQGALNN